MGSNYPAMAYVTTTGTAVVISTGPIQFGGFIRGSNLAGTITIVDSATTIFVHSALAYVSLANPLALRGPVTMTSSAGKNFTVMFRKV